MFPTVRGKGDHDLLNFNAEVELMDLDTKYICKLMDQTKFSCISYSQLLPLLPTQ